MARPHTRLRAHLLALALGTVATVAVAVGPDDAAAQDRVAAPPDSGERNERLGRDPFGSMGGTSPFCRRSGLGVAERRNCNGSGALSHPMRIDHYGWDVHIDTGIDNVTGNFAKGLQDIAQMGWMALLYVVKGVVLLLEWSFSLDLLDRAMGAVKRALSQLHRHVFGQAWFLAAISASGVWAIYRGFVQRRTIETFGGLAATVALMVVALAIINNPVGTVGYASKLANGAALGIVSGATTGSVNGSPRGFGEAMTRVFDQAVLRPWCALQFSDVDFCLSNPRKVVDAADLPRDEKILAAYATAPSIAEMFLAFEPNGRDDVDQRNQIYEEWKGKDGSRLQGVVRIQKEASTGPRLALLTFIAIGMLGMILLFGWIGMRLLGYGVLALVLILFAPVALLAPALGDSGRATFLAWAKRLLGALVAKAIYAALLAIVLVAAGALAELQAMGWIAVWLLQTVFWWVLLVKRNEIVDFVSVPGVGGDRGQRGSLLTKLYYGHQEARMAKGAVAGGIDFARRQTSDRVGERRETKAKAVTTVADRQLREQARPELERRQQDAQQVVARDGEANREVKRLDGLLRGYDERAEVALANDRPAPEATAAEAALVRRRDELAAQRPDADKVSAARERLRHGDVNRARTGGAISAQDERAQLARRRQEIDTLPIDDERNLRAADIDPERYRSANERERERLRAVAQSALDRERTRLAVAGDQHAPPPSRSEVRRAAATLDTAELRAARREEFRARRAERRTRRQGGRRSSRTPR